KTLQDLRARFQTAGEKHPDLRCAMAQVTGHEADADHLLKFAQAFSFLGAPTWGRWGSFTVKPGKYEEIDANHTLVIEPGIGWTIQFYAERPGATAFLKIADDAGWCLPTLVHPEVPPLPDQSSTIGGNGWRWLFMLFHLAWLCPWPGRT